MLTKRLNPSAADCAYSEQVTYYVRLRLSLACRNCQFHLPKGITVIGRV
jgi:hypothetical protein